MISALPKSQGLSTLCTPSSRPPSPTRGLKQSAGWFLRPRHSFNMASRTFYFMLPSLPEPVSWPFLLDPRAKVNFSGLTFGLGRIVFSILLPSCPRRFFAQKRRDWMCSEWRVLTLKLIGISCPRYIEQCWHEINQVSRMVSN